MMSRREFLGAGAAIGLASCAGPRPQEEDEQGEVIVPDVTPVFGGDSVVTTCNMCALGCSVVARRVGERIVALRGNPKSPVNRGKLCAKGHAGLSKVDHPDRLGYPLLRAGARGEGRFRRASWAEALRVVARELRAIRREHGARSVALWQNLNMDRPDPFRRFIYALGSPNFIGHVSTCDASRLLGGAATFGVERASYDYSRAECIVAVGMNPLAARDLVLAAREIAEARARGAKLVTIDPRLSETAARSDVWLPTRPGTDGLLLAGLGRWLVDHDAIDHAFLRDHTLGAGTILRWLRRFDVADVCARTGVTPERFERAARLVADRRSLVAVGRGVVTHADATDATRTAEIVNALLGAFDREGGVRLTPYPPLRLAELEPRVRDPGGERIDRAAADRLPVPLGPARAFELAFFGLSHHVPRNVLDEQPYPLRAMILNAVNPVYSLPQGSELVRAFQRLQLIVSIDAFLTETTRFADVVLPASTYLEGFDLGFPVAAKVSLRQPVVAPRMESRPSQEIILALARAMGLGRAFPFRRYEELVAAQLRGTGVDLPRLREDGFVPWSDEELRFGQRRAEGFRTPSGRVELASSLIVASGGSPQPRIAERSVDDPERPLSLVTYKLPFHTQSATAGIGHLAAIQTDNPLWINGATARAMGVESGDEVRVTSARGEVVARAHVTERIRPDTVALSHHFGHTAYAREAIGRGVSGSEVLGAGTDPIGGNLTFNDARVRVSRA